ncbi:hypothetical protein VIBNISOn1_1050053 [Vibrio nigripulchritudo SOn1]|uniref:Transposase n=1 Tax=Vibrio nigripulchritudo SOn1 TaxID=1238450 RepID=A0AAV2VHT6_9VIBR|nr:hypothetical protein VIBNISOn1_1050053 [Vibrio nigripulchritudo SOn1]
MYLSGPLSLKNQGDMKGGFSERLLELIGREIPLKGYEVRD